MDRCPVPRDLVELKKEIKAANDIVDVIAGYLPIHPAGKLFKCLCPFHNDTRPSLQVDRRYQNYHCWACGAKGDVFDFVETYEKVGFKEAMAILARRAGIAMQTDSPVDSHKLRLFEAMAWAASCFQHNLLEGAHDVPRKYLGSRKLSGATVRQFGLGFAPIDGDWLVRAATRDGISLPLLAEVGLIAEREENRGYYDRFRDRIMFPIRDMQGRPVGFGGRILPDSPLASRAPKYYNSSDTPLFTKSEHLFGLDQARHEGAQTGKLVIVEGYTDVMMAHQLGIKNVVATMGTALNHRHLSVLRRYTPKVVLVFDADAGGLTGVDRALELFVVHDFELAIAALPEGLDPADLLSQEGGDAQFRKSIEEAQDALEFKLNRLTTVEHGTGVEGTRRVLDAILGIMALAPQIPNQTAQLKQDLILTRLSQRLGVRHDLIRQRLRELRTDRSTQRTRDLATGEKSTAPANTHTYAGAGVAPATSANQLPSSQLVLEKQLLQILLAEPEIVGKAREQVPLEMIEHTGIRRILEELFALDQLGIPADLDGVRIRLLDRPDLYRAALDHQQIGRGINDRPMYLRKVVESLARERRSAETRTVKDMLTATRSDDPAAVELLRRLQQQALETRGA